MRPAFCLQKYMDMLITKRNYGSISFPSPCYKQMHKDIIPLPLCGVGYKNNKSDEQYIWEL